MEQVDDNEIIKVSNPSKRADRIQLNKAEAEKVSGWISQVSDASKGFLDLSKSEIINYFIQASSDVLSPKDIAGLRRHYYDPIRHINWIAPQIKLAMANGDFNRVKDLQKEIRQIELARSNLRDAIELTPQTKPNKKRTKKVDQNTGEQNKNLGSSSSEKLPL